MIGFILGFFVGGFFGVATVSCLVAARKGDEQGGIHSDTYAQGFEDGYQEGLHDARWKGESDVRGYNMRFICTNRYRVFSNGNS